MLPYARNMCLGAHVLRGKDQKPFGGKFTDWDVAIWIDSDVVITPQQIQELVDHKLDFVSGLYLMENGLEYAAMRDLDDEYFLKNAHYQALTSEDIKGKRKLLEVDYCGFGCCVTSKKLLYDMEYPWFRSEMVMLNENVQDRDMEDHYFCTAARKKGYQLWIDTGITCPHLKLKPV